MHASHALDALARGAVARPHARGRLADDAGRFRAAVPVDGWSPLWTGLARVGGLLPPAGQPDGDPWALLRGREHASGRGRADGGAVREPCGRVRAQGPRFDVAVEPGGYAWWYLDATSDDGRHGLTVIAFIGSVFSPYYKWSGRRDPENHCAINVALTGPRGKAWAMTERGRAHVRRDRASLVVGPSSVSWRGGALTIDVDQRSAPLGYPVRGRIRVFPLQLEDTAFQLDPAGRHRWHPVAPRARVEVAMGDPAVAWRGDGYLDSNFGDEPLEEGFVDWHWSRAHLKDEVAVLYEGSRRDGAPFGLALTCDRAGRWRELEPPPPARLPRTGWLIDRRTRADAGFTPRVLKTWVDAPFYARTLLETRLFGEDARAVHESLSLDRFRSPVVQTMLPYRMPRVFW